MSFIVAIMIGLTGYQGIGARVLAEGDLVVDVYDRERAFSGIFREEATPGGFPHDPEISARGNMIVGVQRPYLVYEIDRNGTIVWQWRHPEGTVAVAHIRDTNRLPNGNTLIVEVNKLIEVAPNGDIVWQLRVPSIDHDSRFNPAKSLYKAQRIAPNRDVFGN